MKELLWSRLGDESGVPLYTVKIKDRLLQVSSVGGRILGLIIGGPVSDMIDRDDDQRGFVGTR